MFHWNDSVLLVLLIIVIDMILCIRWCYWFIVTIIDYWRYSCRYPELRWLFVINYSVIGLWWWYSVVIVVDIEVIWYIDIIDDGMLVWWCDCCWCGIDYGIVDDSEWLWCSDAVNLLTVFWLRVYDDVLLLLITVEAPIVIRCIMMMLMMMIDGSGGSDKLLIIGDYYLVLIFCDDSVLILIRPGCSTVTVMTIVVLIDVMIPITVIEVFRYWNSCWWPGGRCYWYACWLRYILVDYHYHWWWYDWCCGIVTLLFYDVIIADWWPLQCCYCYSIVVKFWWQLLIVMKLLLMVVYSGDWYEYCYDRIHYCYWSATQIGMGESDAVLWLPVVIVMMIRYCYSLMMLWNCCY